MVESLKNKVHITNNWQIIEKGLRPKKSSDIDISSSKSFYRFMSLETFKYMLSGSFRINNPIKWKDPYENLFVNGNYDAINYLKPSVYAACFTKEANSEASWKVYTMGKETCVRVEFDMVNFIGTICLADIFENTLSLYIGDVSYDLPDNSLRALGKKTTKYYALAFPPDFSNDNFVDLLLLKRKSFKYEQESRLIILNYGEQRDYMTLYYPPEMFLSFVKSIQIDPNCDPEYAQNLMSKFQHRINSWKKPLYHYNPEISQSTLYQKISPVIVEK